MTERQKFLFDVVIKTAFLGLGYAALFTIEKLTAVKEIKFRTESSRQETLTDAQFPFRLMSLKSDKYDNGQDEKRKNE